MKFTRKGYGQLRRADDTFVSQHTVAEEAYERSSREGPGVYTWHPARIEIEVPAAAAPEPAPQPAPAPAPAPEPTPAPAPAPQPSGKLLRKTDLRYVGAFRVPLASGQNTFEWGGTAMGLGPAGKSLYLASHDQQQWSAEISIPTPRTSGYERAALLQPYRDPTEGKLPQIAPGYNQALKLGGHLCYGGKLYVSGWAYYDADGQQKAFLFERPLSLADSGKVRGPVQIPGQVPARFMAGYMAPIPSEWQATLGGPAFAFGGSLQQISEASCGPAFGVFDPDTVSSGGGNVSLSDLLWYDNDRPVEPFTPAHPGFTQYNAAGGTDYLAIQTLKTGTAFIYPGSRSLLFIYGHGYGPYGNAGSDGCYPGSSVHSAPFRLQVVAYDLRDLVAVKNGTKQPWEPKPYAWWLLGPDDYGALGVCVGLEQGCFAYDPTTRKLYGCRELAAGNDGRINVWQIGTL